MTGGYDLCQVIAATLARLPACRHLRIATLCYNKRNAAELLGILETRPDLKLTLLVSDFFRGHNKELHEWFQDELGENPNARIAAGRTHCKVVGFELPADEVSLVIEGSANLRTNHNREQLAVIRDGPLHDWHAGWIDEMVRSDAQVGQDDNRAAC